MTAVEPHPQRPIWTAMGRGLRGHCPRCGRGRLFRAFLKVVEDCESCRQPLHHHRADDAPAYFVILLVGHLVVPLALSAAIAFTPPYWVHFTIWLPMTLLLSLLLLQPIKGAIVGWQWAARMHGFDETNARDAEWDAGMRRPRR